MSEQAPPLGPAADMTSPADQPPSGEELIAAVYQRVAEALDIDPNGEEIPIREYVDPDALAHLFNTRNDDVFVSFPVQDVRVTIHGDGSIYVRPAAIEA